MGIAFDAYSADDANVNVDASWTHTPVGTPKAAIVFLAMTATSTDTVVGITYGGTAMTEIAGSPRTHSAGADDSVIHIFKLNDPASGAQTVAVDVGVGATTYRGACITVTTDGGAVELDSTAGNDSGAGTGNGGTVTIATTAARDTVCLFLFHSGEAVVGSISTDGTNLGEYDYGAQTASYNRLDGAGGNVSCTLTQSADSWHGFGAAFGEAAGGPTTFFQTIPLTVTFTLTTPSQVNKVVALGTTLTAGVQRQTSKLVALGSTFGLEVVRSFTVGKLIEIGVTFTTATQRQANRIIALGSDFGVVVRRQANKVIALASTFTGAVSRSVSVIRGLGVTFTPGVAMGLLFQKLIAISPAFTPVVVRGVGKLVALGSTFAALVDRVFQGGVHEERPEPINTAKIRDTRPLYMRRGRYL